MPEKKVKPSDLQAEAQRLIAAGKMPSPEKLLNAVADVRKKFRPGIEKARKDDE